ECAKNNRKLQQFSANKQDRSQHSDNKRNRRQRAGLWKIKIERAKCPCGTENRCEPSQHVQDESEQFHSCQDLTCTARPQLERGRATDESAIKCRREAPCALPVPVVSGYALFSFRFGNLVLVLFHIVFSHFPALVRIVLFHALERLQRIGSEVLLVNDSVWTNDECHYSSHAVFSGCRSQGKSPDHCTADHEVHFSPGCRWSLSL